MKTILVLTPEVRIFESMSDGSRLLRETQSLQAQRHIQSSIVQELRRRAFTVRSGSQQTIAPGGYAQLTALFRSVNRSIQLHTYGPQIYPDKCRDFDYSVGDVADLLQANGADGLIMTIGYQGCGESGRANWLSIAVIEPEGHVIWYNLTGAPTLDMQNPHALAAMVNQALRGFWGSAS